MTQVVVGPPEIDTASVMPGILGDHSRTRSSTPRSSGVGKNARLLVSNRNRKLDGHKSSASGSNCANVAVLDSSFLADAAPCAARHTGVSITRAKLEEIFDRLGRELRQPATLCVFGSAPSILLGQPERQTSDVDVWFPASNFDAGDLAQACTRSGLLYDPKGEIDPDAIYLRIVRPGVVTMPPAFESEPIGRYGKLTVHMPIPLLLTAMKLVRANERDVEDIVWWVRHRQIEFDQLASMVATLPNRRDREVASENMILVRLISGGEVE